MTTQTEISMSVNEMYQMFGFAVNDGRVVSDLDNGIYGIQSWHTSDNAVKVSSFVKRVNGGFRDVEYTTSYFGKFFARSNQISDAVYWTVEYLLNGRIQQS